MASGADYFLSKTLGDDFFESLAKVELWKPGTKSTIDHEELKTALQIVPRTIMALLIRELAPLQIGDNHKIQLPVPGGATLMVTKHERDVYSGEIDQGGKVIVDFKLRALPGVGLVIMSAFELYDMENLINENQGQVHTHDYSKKVSEVVQKMIDERLALHDLIGKVVDKKIMERDAVHQLVLRRLSEMMGDREKISEVTKIAKDPGNAGANEYMRGMANGLEVANATVHNKEPEFVDAPKTLDKTEKKKRPLAEFFEKKHKKQEYSVVMSKGEQVDCPDCGKNIFNGKIFSGCVCLGDDMEKKVFIKKEQDGIKVRFSKGWDEENIEMLLEVLRKKNA